MDLQRRTMRPDPVPRAVLLGGAALLLGALLTVGSARLSGQSARAPDAPAAQQRALRFEDRPDGGIAVIDGASGRLIETVHGEQGFLRGALRGLARERMRRGLGPAQPFELVARTDGRLTLLDPATGERIDLESFGPANAGIFARWLTANATPQPQE
jgi:putative photosynthetic complex assembly protein